MLIFNKTDKVILFYTYIKITVFIFFQIAHGFQYANKIALEIKIKICCINF